jgi:hypothetical protein
VKEEEIIKFYDSDNYFSNLHTFYRYVFAAHEQRAAVCNGAGPRRFGWLVPDTFWGLCITESANNHDWDYQWGETIEDKHEADRTFRNNMLRQADTLRVKEKCKTNSWICRKWNEYKHQRRLDMINEYFKAVDSFGGPAFWDKTNVGFHWTDISTRRQA